MLWTGSSSWGSHRFNTGSTPVKSEATFRCMPTGEGQTTPAGILTASWPGYVVPVIEDSSDLLWGSYCWGRIYVLGGRPSLIMTTRTMEYRL